MVQIMKIFVQRKFIRKEREFIEKIHNDYYIETDIKSCLGRKEKKKEK